MNKKSLDLSKQIDPLTLEIFQSLAKVSNQLKIAFFVVGAKVRDMILTDGYGIKTSRATKDVDFGVMLDNWEDFHQFKNALIISKDFESTKIIHRLKYKNAIPIDLVPFGKISEPDNLINWPPKDETKMNVLGFKEAYEYSISVKVQVKPALYISCASLAGLALMKIISWNNGDDRTTKDAEDLAVIFRTYLDAGNFERIYDGEEFDLINDEDSDYVQIGARLLGRDIARMLHDDTKDQILKILDRETQPQTYGKLIHDIMKNKPLTEDYDNDFEENLKLLENVKKGIEEKTL
jgi:predicted nucleotidyltransferase